MRKALLVGINYLNEPSNSLHGCVTDVVNIGSVDPDLGIFIDTEVLLDLNIIANDLSSLGCPPNDFVV